VNGQKPEEKNKFNRNYRKKDRICVPKRRRNSSAKERERERQRGNRRVEF
jgi:hypothetical protein